MVHIQLIIGSTRDARFADKPAAWLSERLGAREDLTLEAVDLRDYPLPFYNSARSPAYTQRDYPTEQLAAWGRKLDEADGYIFLVAEYNHAYTAVLKNALDSVYPELNRKPVAFVGYGGVGGARAVEQLRLVAVELEMAPLRHAVHILPDVFGPALQSNPLDTAVFAPLEPRLEKLATDLVWWAGALKAAREAG
jgi:NAD(P)H-dependent FMN reductase